MIKVNMDLVELNGTVNNLLSELSLVIHAVALEAEEKNMPYQTAIDNAFKGARLYPLIESGMSIEEALEVVGIDKKNINIGGSTIPDNVKRETK